MSFVIPSPPGSGARFSERYEIKNQAGMGGMGTVYQALDRETRTLVALKILHSRNTIEQARFDQEARVLAELSHPGIVRYFDHGMTPNGAPYIAMEWLEGETLEDRLGRATLTPAAAAHMAHLVLEALSAAHSRNIVHRDIKPGNIFLVGWKLTEIRLLDFGIARRVFDAKRLTRKGSTVGTPLYTSPEQARGRADVDGRADIFSLGCVLFETITGEPPFTGETPLEVMTKVCVGRVPDLASLRPDIPAPVTKLVHAMLAPDVAQRPASAAALAADFAQVARSLGGIDGENAAASPPVPGKRENIGDSEEHLACAMLVSLDRRDTGSDTERAALTERRHGPKATSVVPSVAERANRAENDTRLAEIRRLLERYACELDRLINRTLLITAPTVSSAQEQAIQLASAALALRAQEPGAKIAIATGRATFLGRLPVGRLMERLPTLLEGQAAGSVRMDETTRRLLAMRFATHESREEILLVAETDPAAARISRGSDGCESPFLGREREVGSLLSALDECRGDKVARAVLVISDPGLGKSRIVREFLARAPAPGPAVVRAYGTLLRIERRYPTLAPVLAAAGIDAQGKSSPAIEAALTAWLKDRAAASGVMLLIEDLQWADGPSLDLIDRLLLTLHDQPFIVVGVGREEVEDRFPGLWSARSVQRIRLRPLAQKAGAQLLDFWLPGANKSASEFILERWEGNPQFLEELSTNAGNQSVRISDAVYAVVEGRFELLEADVRRVLRAASLFAEKTFTVDSLIALLGEQARKSMAEWLEVLVMRGILDRDVRMGEASYRFHDRLVSDAAYHMLTTTDRAQGRRLARAFLLRVGRTLPRLLSETASQTSQPLLSGQ